MEKFIGADTASIELFYNIFASGIETFVIPWEGGTNFHILCRNTLPPGIGTTVTPLCHSKNADCDQTGIS